MRAARDHRYLCLSWLRAQKPKRSAEARYPPWTSRPPPEHSARLRSPSRLGGRRYRPRERWTSGCSRRRWRDDLCSPAFRMVAGVCSAPSRWGVRQWGSHWMDGVWWYTFGTLPTPRRAGSILSSVRRWHGSARMDGLRKSFCSRQLLVSADWRDR